MSSNPKHIFYKDYIKYLKEKNMYFTKKGERFTLTGQEIIDLQKDNFGNHLKGGFRNTNDRLTQLAKKIDKENNEYFFGINSINI